jgi:prolyl oligopeptidase
MSPRRLTFCLLSLLTACTALHWGPGPAQQLPLRSFPPADRPPASPLPAFAAPTVATGEAADDYHGERIADPYRWLEDQDGEPTKAFVAAQNASSRAFLDALPTRSVVHRRLAELWNFPRTAAPERFGDRWFWSHNDGLQNQPVWFTATAPHDDGTVLLDPNTLSSDGTTALAGFRPSHDGSLVAFATSERGSDWQSWQVLEVSTARLRPDRLRWAKFTAAAWTHDGLGFFYQRYPAPAEGDVYQQKNETPQLCYHRLGTDQAEDRIVYERPDEPGFLFRCEISADGRFLLITIASGTKRQNRLACVDLQQEGWPVQPLRMAGDAHYAFVGNDGETFWLRTDLAAPNARLIAIDRRQPELATEVLAAGKNPLQDVQLCGDRFVCTYLVDAAHELRLHRRDGSAAGAVPLPDLGSVASVVGRTADPVFYVTFQSFAHAPTVLRHDVSSGVTDTFRPSELQFDGSGLVTARQFLQSRDGTRLCLFVVHRRDLKLDGTNPTYLYGYGGFHQVMSPRFSVPNLVFVERGGIYAQAVLRGGGEYGEAWHQAGMRAHKQNVFDDFIAGAEYLQRNRYTDRHRLAIGGGSNGGLLVGACLTQRPELFAAAIPEVGVMDMLRYHQFTIGWAWASEYGTSADAEQFLWLRGYSPLHRLQPGTHYPATLVMTGDHDDRVLPGHSYKFAAALQQAQAGPAPILLRVETSAGHGAGKPVSKLIDEAADRWAFLDAVFGRTE